MNQGKASDTHTDAEIHTEIPSKQQTGNHNTYDRYL